MKGLKTLASQQTECNIHTLICGGKTASEETTIESSRIPYRGKTGETVLFQLTDEKHQKILIMR